MVPRGATEGPLRVNSDVLEATSTTEAGAITKVLAAARIGTDLPDREGLRELLQRALGRGYVLASELNELHDPLIDEEDADAWVDRVSAAARGGPLVGVFDRRENHPAQGVGVTGGDDASAVEFLDHLRDLAVLRTDEDDGSRGGEDSEQLARNHHARPARQHATWCRN